MITSETLHNRIADGSARMGDGTYVSTLSNPTRYTITVTGDWSGMTTIGGKVKLTHSSTVKYFYVVAATTYSAGTNLSTLTLWGGPDYTLSASAITAVYYSGSENPAWFPGDGLSFYDSSQSNGGVWFALTTGPTLGNGTLIAKLKFIGKIAFVFISLKFGSTTNGGAGAYYFRMPFQGYNYGYEAYQQVQGYAINTGIFGYQVVGSIGSQAVDIYAVRQSDGTGISATNPFTFGDGDTINITGTFLTSL